MERAGRYYKKQVDKGWYRICPLACLLNKGKTGNTNLTLPSHYFITGVVVWMGEGQLE